MRGNGLQSVLQDAIKSFVEGNSQLEEARNRFVESVCNHLGDDRAFRADSMLQLVLDNIPARVFWKDREGKFLGCNRLFAEDMGIGDPGEIVGKDDYCFAKTREKADYFRKVDREVMKRGEPQFKIREQQEVPGEPHRWLETNKVPLFDKAGEVVGILGTYENITERVRSEERLSRANAELARASRMKDQFLAGMSHELRTPLNAILGLSEALREEIYGDLNERQNEALGRIEAGGRHLLALINDILDIAKFEAGEVALDIRPVGVRQVCADSLSYVREQAGKSAIALDWSVEEQIDFLVADERRVKQMLVNLLSNAVKFTEKGGKVSLNVSGSRDGSTLDFAVRDTGIGIPEAHLGGLFKPFRQVDSSLSRAYDGAGLGLSLVKHMCELHGGYVEVESVLGEGSCFTVRLPWRAHAGEHDSGDSKEPWRGPGRPPTVPGVPLRALVIEDCSDSARQVQRYLVDSGYEVAIVGDGERALSMALADVPDLIILDILLPGISGWTVLDRLRANRRTRDVPVVIVSMVDEKGNAHRFGANGYVVKPIDRETFCDGLERAGIHTGPVAGVRTEGEGPAQWHRQVSPGEMLAN